MVAGTVLSKWIGGKAASVEESSGPFGRELVLGKKVESDNVADPNRILVQWPGRDPHAIVIVESCDSFESDLN